MPIIEKFFFNVKNMSLNPVKKEHGLAQKILRRLRKEKAYFQELLSLL